MVECKYRVYEDVAGCFDHPDYRYRCKIKHKDIVPFLTCKNCKIPKIMDGLEYHYTEAQKIFPKEQIVGIFLQGSQNYNMDTENSDIDSKLLVLPTLKEIASLKEPKSSTHILPNGEHLDYKDIRLFINTLYKQNINFLEILYTDYFFLNPNYVDLWNNLVQARDYITKFNPVATIKAARGTLINKLKIYDNPSSDWKREEIDKYGYSPKEFSAILRVDYFINHYLSNDRFINCLRPEPWVCEHFKRVKQGALSKEEVKEIIETQIKDTLIACDKHIDNTKTAEDKWVVDLLENAKYNFVKRSLQNEFNFSSF